MEEENNNVVGFDNKPKAKDELAITFHEFLREGNWNALGFHTYKREQKA